VADPKQCWDGAESCCGQELYYRQESNRGDGEGAGGGWVRGVFRDGGFEIADGASGIDL